MTPKALAGEQAGRVHDRDAGEEAADCVTRREPAGSAAGNEAADLDDDLERSAGCEREEEDAEDVARDVAADPGAEDRRGTPAMRASAARRPTGGRPPPSATGAAMPSPSVTLWIMKPTMRNVPSCELAERERAADREPFAEVVDADADRDEQRKRHPTGVAAPRRAAAPRGTSCRDS